MKVDINKPNRFKISRIKMSKTCPSHETNKPWPMVRLGDVCEIIAGQSPEGSYYTDESCYTEFHQGSKSFGIRELQVSGVYTKKETKIAKPGSLLISVRAPVGDLNVTTRRVCIGRGLAALIPDDSLSRDFLWLFLTSATKAVNDAAGAGSCFSSLSRSQLSGLEIPLPPLTEQKEIVARLERELAAVEKMKKGFEAIAETAKAEFKAELKEVFEELKRDGAGMRKIGDVCTEISTGPFGSSLHKNDYIVGGTPIINPMHIVGQRLIPTDNMAVDEKTIARLSAYCLRENDVIIGRRGEMGRAALVTSREKGWLCGTGCFFLRLRANVSPRYFVELLCSDYCKSQMEHQAIGTTIPNLNHTILREIEMPMPELAEQEWVVGSVTALRAKMEKLEAKAREGVAVCETMRKAILKEAFE